METILEQSPNKCCILCSRNTVDEVTLGPLYSRNGVVSHYYCLMFCSNLAQKGKTDNDGILGFLLEDIKREVNRLSRSRMKCIYCKQKGPSIGCCIKRCRGIWHFPCGLENNANHQFFKKHESYCPAHTKYPEALKQVKVAPDAVCSICYNDFNEESTNPKTKRVYASCCKDSVFHKPCIQKYALSAGYYFKCPTCNTAKRFVQDMQWHGIFVPQEDASWEKETNAFGDLLQKHSECDINPCQCSKGKNHNGDVGPWRLIICGSCGASGSHIRCGRILFPDSWECATCRQMITKKRPLWVTKPELTLADDEEEEINYKTLKLARRDQDYFPLLSREDLIRYGDAGRPIPDWRKFTVGVHLIDLFKKVE